MIDFSINRINPNQNHFLGVADTLIVYTMLAPMIYLIIGSHLELGPDIFRTLLILLGPGVLAGAIYLKFFGIQALKRSKWIIVWMLAFTFIYALSCIIRIDNEPTRESIKFFLGWCLFGFCLGTISNMSISRSPRFNKIWIVFVIGFLIYVIYYRWPNLTHFFRMKGINVAQTGTLFYFFALCTLFYFYISNHLLPRIIAALLLLFCFICAFFSGTRTASFGLLISFVISLYFYWHIRRSKYLPIVIASLLTITIFALVPNLNSFVKYNKHTKTLEDMKNLISYLKADDPVSINPIARLRIWAVAIDKFKENPIFGSGVGILYHDKDINKDFVHPHNIVLELLAETGIMGFGVFLILFVFIFKRTVSIYKETAVENRMTFLFYPISLLFFFLYSFLHTDLSTEYFKWYFAGMITGFDVKNSGIG